MSMKTLDAASGAADAARRSGSTGPLTAELLNHSITLGSIDLVSMCQGVCIDSSFGVLDPTYAFEPTDHPVEFLADQPITGRHRGAVIEEGTVPQHHRAPGEVTNHHLERALRRAPEQGSYLGPKFGGVRVAGRRIHLSRI
jgi:hypothetical protein